jgi:hypothetical protein
MAAYLVHDWNIKRGNMKRSRAHAHALCDVNADLDNLAGLDVLLATLGPDSSEQLRAAAANALAVAASNNNEFMDRLWQKGGRDVLDKLLQVSTHALVCPLGFRP